MYDLIGMICPSIDVEIETFDSDSGIRSSIKGDWASCDAVSWLCRIKGIESNEIPDAISKNLGFMTLVNGPKGPVGRASLNPVNTEFGAYTIGGLAKKRNESVTTAPNFIGTLDGKPEGPRRDSSEKLDAGIMRAWASEQAKVWAEAEISEQEKNFIAANACFFGGDPLPLANAQIDGQWYNVSQIYDLLLNCKVIFAPIRPNDINGEQWSIMERVNLLSGHLYHPEDIEIEQKNILVSGPTERISRYWSLSNNSDPVPESIFGCIARFAIAKGTPVELKGSQVDYGYYKGQTIPRERRTYGDRLILPTIELRLLNSDN